MTPQNILLRYSSQQNSKRKKKKKINSPCISTNTPLPTNANTWLNLMYQVQNSLQGQLLHKPVKKKKIPQSIQLVLWSKHTMNIINPLFIKIYLFFWPDICCTLCCKNCCTRIITIHFILLFNFTWKRMSSWFYDWHKFVCKLLYMIEQLLRLRIIAMIW